MGCRISQWYSGYFAGDVFTNGTYVSSDERAKQNIADLTGAMKIINQLHPKRYQYRQDGEYGQMNLPRGDHHGLIAQEVEQVLPGLVKETVFVPERLALILSIPTLGYRRRTDRSTSRRLITLN